METTWELIVQSLSLLGNMLACILKVYLYQDSVIGEEYKQFKIYLRANVV